MKRIIALSCFGILFCWAQDRVRVGAATEMVKQCWAVFGDKQLGPVYKTIFEYYYDRNDFNPEDFKPVCEKCSSMTKRDVRLACGKFLSVVKKLVLAASCVAVGIQAYNLGQELKMTYQKAAERDELYQLIQAAWGHQNCQNHCGSCWGDGYRQCMENVTRCARGCVLPPVSDSLLTHTDSVIIDELSQKISMGMVDYGQIEHCAADFAPKESGPLCDTTQADALKRSVVESTAQAIRERIKRQERCHSKCLASGWSPQYKTYLFGEEFNACRNKCLQPLKQSERPKLPKPVFKQNKFKQAHR